MRNPLSCFFGTRNTATSSTATESTSQVQAFPEVNAGRTQRRPDQRFAALAPQRPPLPPASRPITHPPRPQNASPATPQKTNAELFVEWDDWAQKGHAQDGNRAEAVRLMKAWVDNNDTDEPINLQGLRLTSLPENLPKNLKSLSVCDNRLSSLPENLPKNLTSLFVDFNQFTRLPENLPESLEFLSVFNNRLSSLPENLPKDLKNLILDYNRLTRLPENLPANLCHFEVRSNLLTSLPDNLPASLHVLHATSNPLSSLPENILNLPNTCNIYIAADHLSPHALNELERAMDTPGYDNVRIRYTLSPSLLV